MKRMCINCKTQYGCVVGVEVKVCGQCDNICSQSEEPTHGLCDPCFPIVRALNKSKRIAELGTTLPLCEVDRADKELQITA